MKKVLLLLPAVSVMELTSGVIHAQPQTDISIGGDLVSTYVWRGVYQSGFSLQPEIGLSVGGFTVGVWGSTDLDNFKEVDLSVGYSVRGFSVGVTDYWWGGQRLGDGRFAPYFKYGDTHYFEGTLAYEFGEKFPLGISWSTMFAGADKKENGDRAWSSYVELAYPFSVGSVELTAAAGAAPWAAPAWLPGGYDGFQISNVSLKASRAIPVSEKYEIPLFVQLAVNPQLNYMNLVIGLSF
ncbi:TorF family putative porin [Alistipes ihumii]|uniref:TorF family putative porin n=1 Tax=Alistipes ihumii TaxID=1470347 RepID=UPI002666F9F1|nr:TorF family putative porin [Alistipes ihumii]MEE1419608.1 TorF family putative porin [Alistipes ihumii]